MLLTARFTFYRLWRPAIKRTIEICWLSLRFKWQWRSLEDSGLEAEPAVLGSNVLGGAAHSTFGAQHEKRLGRCLMLLVAVPGHRLGCQDCRYATSVWIQRPLRSSESTSGTSK